MDVEVDLRQVLVLCAIVCADELFLEARFGKLVCADSKSIGPRRSGIGAHQIRGFEQFKCTRIVSPLTSSIKHNSSLPEAAHIDERRIHISFFSHPGRTSPKSPSEQGAGTWENYIRRQKGRPLACPRRCNVGSTT